MSVSRSRGGAQSAAAYRLVTLAISTRNALTTSDAHTIIMDGQTTKIKKKTATDIVLQRLLSVSFELLDPDSWEDLPI